MTIAISGTTGITLDGQFNSASSMGFKNRIINGAMVIDQRNAGASVSTASVNPFTVDRWQVVSSPASKFTAQQNAGSITPPAGFTNYLGITSSSAYSSAAGDLIYILQSVEGYNTADLGFGTANAVTVTLSFRVYSSLTGTFGGALRNYGSTRSYPFTYTISSANTWTTISITIAGDTSGTWVGASNAGSMVVFFNLGSGSTYQGTAGAWAAADYRSATGATSVVGTNGATFYITGVQLEKGSTATSFDYRPYGTELALCQRYYETYSNGTGTGAIYEGITGSFATTAVFRGFVPFKVTKRASPSLVVPTTYTTINWSGGNITPSAGGSNFSSTEGASINFTTSTVTAGQAATAGISSSAPVTISAEL